MTENTAINDISKKVRTYLESSNTKGVSILKEMDKLELTYQLIFCLEEVFGQTPPEEGKVWYGVKPLTNVACKVGQLILIQHEEGLTERVRNENRFKNGYQLLSYFVENGILDFKKGILKRDKYRIRVRKGKEQEFADIMSIISKIEPVLPIHTMPQFVEPEPFTKFYHPQAGVMVRNVNSDAISSFTIEEMPKVFEVINTHMKNSYAINISVLETFKNCQEDDIFTFADKDIDEEQLGGLERERNKVMELADMVGFRDFWEYAFYDNRGRLYSSSVYLSHAGSKLSKSLYLFSEKKVIGTEGWFWLLVHTANVFGYDKDTVDGRFDFAKKHLDQWIEIAKNPVKNKLWQQADSPFEFLAAIIELHKAVSSGDRMNYESGLPVAWDASCSGLQILSALARDEESGKLCNLTNTEERGDYYLHIADSVWEECVYTDEEERLFEDITLNLKRLDNNVKLAFESKDKETITNSIEERKEYSSTHRANIYAASKVFWGKPEMKKLRRKLNKRPCMTYFYSCSAKTMANQMFIDFASEPEFKGLTSSYCFWICKRIYDSCRTKMPVPTSLMDMFIKLGVDDYNAEKDFSIRAPFTNFNFVQTYRSDVSKQISVGYKKGRIQVKVNVEKGKKIDRQKVLSGTSPNIVHMLDSQIVAGMILHTGYTISTIHDSFSSHACNAGKLFEDTREVFVQLFNNDILLEMLEQKNATHYYDEIVVGKLNLDGVYDNEYCFS